MPASSAPPTPYYLTTSLDHSLCFEQCALGDQVGEHARDPHGGGRARSARASSSTATTTTSSVDQSLGGPMTIAFWARWDALNSWSRLCDFGGRMQMTDNILIYA